MSAPAEAILKEGDLRRFNRLMYHMWERFVTGGEVPEGVVRPVVLESWRRCRDLGIDPLRTKAPVVLTPEAVADLTGKEDLVLAAGPVVERLEGHVTEAGHILFLADAAGRILVARGCAESVARAADIHAVPGGEWTENATGNNAIGTSIATGEPVQFVCGEHFCTGWQGWTCAAAPIRHPLSGQTVGVVDVTGYLVAGHPHNLALVELAAAQVEARLLEIEERRWAEVIRMFEQAEAHWSRGAALVAVDRFGWLLRANERAAQWLDAGATARRRDADGTGSERAPNLKHHPVWAAAIDGALSGCPFEGQVPAELTPVPVALTVSGLPVFCGGGVAGALVVARPSGGSWPGFPGPVRGAGLRDAALRPAADGWLVGRRGEKFYLLRLDDVLYVHSEGTSVLVETVSGTYSAVQPSLRHLEEYLEPLGFFRVSRHHLVNLRHVREIIPMFNRTYRLVLDDPRGTRLDVSRRRSSLLRLALGF